MLILKKNIMLIYIKNKEEKNMKKSALLFILPALLLSSCGGDNPPANKDDCYASYELAASLRKADTEKTGGYNLSFHYKSEYFEKDATVFNKDLALLSSGMSMMAESEATIKNFYNSVYFDEVETHYVEHTKDSVCYALASRKYESYDLISVVVSGNNYGLEWANNALVGLEGDHEGFSLRANDIYASLKTFLADHTNYKIWISGYSRGGAIANVLSHYILSKEEIEIAQKDMFVYTFECPKGLDKNNAPEYNNVFNVLYSGDLVTYVGPSEYGFARCGKDIDLFTTSEDFDNKIKAFDEDISIPSFAEYDSLLPENIHISNEIDGLKDIVSYITRVPESESYISLNTRSDYVTNVQDAIQTAVSIFFGLPSEEINKIKAAITELGFSALNVLTDGQQLYNFITPFLDEIHYEYDLTNFRKDCDVIAKLAGSEISVIAAIYLSVSFGPNIIRSVKSHFPEVGYALLADYNPNK